MKRHSLIIILAIVSSITIILVILGFKFSKTEMEKINGFSGLFTISENGDIAFANYNKGETEVYLHGKENNPILTLDAKKEITDMIYSPDGTALYYIVNDKELTQSSKLESVIYFIDINSLQQKELLRENKLLTEITFDPKDEDILFYLGAEIFENYSPIARAAPHDFDIYSYSIKENDITRHTEFKKYSIDSLQVSHTEHIVYVQMADDFDAETADDIFEMKQKVFEIPLENPEKLNIVSDGAGVTDDIYDMFYIYQYDIIVFQAVSQTGADGIYKYELFELDLQNNKNTQLTYLTEHAAQPTYSAHDDQIYFIVDKQFAKQHSDYYLYRMNRDGSDIEELHLN